MRFSFLPTSAELEGAILAHSINAGTKKFKKGHHLSTDDIQQLLNFGINDVMVAILEKGDFHEDDAAKILSDLIKGTGLNSSTAFTGRVNLFAASAGICQLNMEGLKALNRLDEAITVATLANFELVQAKQMVATIKIIPFGVSGEIIEQAKKIVSGPMISLESFRTKKICLIQTFHEGTKLRVLDKTSVVLNNRLIALQNEIMNEQRCLHDTQSLSKEISKVIDVEQPDILILTGASAITDRNDVLPAALSAAGGSIQRFGMPVDPGNLLMLGVIDKTKVIGMPGCARSPKLNGFDWVLQRLLVGIQISNDDISDMAIGGLLKEIATRPLPRATSVSKAATISKSTQITAVILAAGQSRRMGKNNKLLMEINGIPMVRHSVDIILSAQIDDVIVVTGHEQAEIKGALSGLNVSYKHNSLYENGISSSLKVGIANVPVKSDGVLICLGDMPLITNDDIKCLIAAFNPSEGRAICVPTYKGKWGNPVLIGKQFFAEIQDLSGDIGARHLISDYPDLVCEVEVESDGVLSDFDVPESFDRFH